MININDVAAKAKVSTATVSRVLNGKDAVSLQTRERVLSACSELNYRLNSNIQDLVLKSRNGATRNIAFVLVDREFADPAYSSLIDGLSTAANDWHYHLTLVKISGRENTIYDLPPVIRDERVDGILVAGNLIPHTVDLLLELRLSCVVIGNYRDRLLRSLCSVQINLETLFYDLIEQVIKTGRKRIALVEENPDSYATTVYIETYKNALRDAGIAFDEKICYLGKGARTGAFPLLKSVFMEPELPFDAIVCTDMRIATEVSHLLYGYYGLKTPIDCTLATLREFEYSDLPVPAIYGSSNGKTRVEVAMQMLVDKIEGRQITQKIVLT